MPAPHIETDWYQRLPAAYRDRVQWDPGTGYPTCIDVAAGAYTVPGALTNADMVACSLPPLIQHEPGWR